jgi:hypothetical protein
VGVDGSGEVGIEGVYMLGGGVGRAECGGEAKKSAVRERFDACKGDLGETGGRLGVAENGEAKKAWVLVADDGGGALRASGERSEKDEEREDVALMRLRWERGDDVVEMDSSGRVVEAGDHCCASMLRVRDRGDRITKV